MKQEREGGDVSSRNNAVCVRDAMMLIIPIFNKVLYIRVERR